MASKLYQKIVNSYINQKDPEHIKSRLLKEGEYHIPLHNFSGPGTKIEDEYVRNFKPYNEIDNCSKIHDIGYSETKNPNKIQKLDEEAIECYDKYPKTYGHNLAKMAMKAKNFGDKVYTILKGTPSILYGGTFEDGIEVISTDFAKGGNFLEFEKEYIVPNFKGFNKNAKNMMARRNLPDSESLEMKNVIKLISYNFDNVFPFGSWIYRSQQYPGDIDLIEEVILEIDPNEDYSAINEYLPVNERGVKEEGLKIKQYFAKVVQNIVKKIGEEMLTGKPIIIGDIKAGLDRRFMINIGKLVYDDKGNYKILDYNSEKIIEELNKLRKHFIEKYSEGEGEERGINEDINEIIDMVKPLNEMTDTDYENLFELLRKYWLIRWSTYDISNGIIRLTGPYDRSFYGFIYLTDAISHPTMTKIDLIAYINGRFIEVTNVLSFFTINKNNPHEKKVINFTNELGEEGWKSLKKEVEKYAFSGKYFKPMKMAKRIWSLARMMKNEKVVKDITPIMQSDLGRLSQIVSDLESIMYIVEDKPVFIAGKNYRVGDEIYSYSVGEEIYSYIDNELEYMKFRLSNIYDIEISREDIDEFHEIVDKKKYFHLSIIKKKFTKYINRYALTALKNLGYYPPPKEFLP